MRRLSLLAAFFLLSSPACCRFQDQPARRTVRDGLRRDVSLPPVPRRIVSLAPSVTESVLALGFGDRLVGVSDFCRPPVNGGPVARVGGLLNPDLETIRSLHPDLLVGTTSGNDPDLAGQAGALGIPLYILDAPDIDGVLAGLEGLADALGDRPRGRQVAEGLRGRLEAVTRRVQGRARPRVLFVIWGDPLVVPGAPAFLTDAISRAGGSSVTADAPAAHPAFSLESAIARAPEIIVMTRDNMALAERLRADPAWAGVPAVRSGRVETIEERAVQPGPGVVAGIEEMARLFHPEAFEGKEVPRNK
jgi:iron complex transport system substrate-binding protein